MIFKDIDWLQQTWDDASVELTAELSLTVTVSAEAGTETIGEEKGFAAGATKLVDVVGAKIMPSKLTLGSLCGHILMFYKRLFNVDPFQNSNIFPTSEKFESIILLLLS